MRKYSASLGKKYMQIKSTNMGNWAFLYAAGERAQMDAIFVEGNLAIPIRSLKNVHTYILSSLISRNIPY